MNCWRVVQRACSGGLAILVVVASGAALAAEPDPDVPCVESTSGTLLAYGEHTSPCEIMPATDINRAHFAGVATERVRIVIRSLTPALDPRFRLFDPDGVLVKDTFCNGNPPPLGSPVQCTAVSDETLPNKTGTYRILVSDEGSDETGNFRLQLERLPASSPAAELLYGADAAETIAPSTDMDWFELSGTAGAEVRIDLRSTSAAFDPRIEVYGPDGSQIADATCNGNPPPLGTSVRCSNSLELTLPATGDYAIGISDANSDENGTFDVQVQCLAGSCSAAIPEPSPPFTVMDVPFAASVSPSVDADAFAFRGHAGSVVRLHLRSATAGLDPRVELRDPLGMSVDEASCNGNPPPLGSAVRCTLALELALTATGDYRVLVSDLAIDETGDAQLAVECIHGPCDGDGDGALDPIPLPVVYALQRTTVLGSTVDLDAFALQVSAGDLLEVTLSSRTNGLDPRIEVFGPSGALLEDRSCNGNPPPFGTPVRCIASFEFQAGQSGTHRLLLSDLAIDESGGVAVSVQCLVGPCLGLQPPDDRCVGGATAGCSDGCPAVPNPDQADGDADGAGDVCDVCASFANADQRDEGGVGNGSLPDGIGDACQCGDVNGNGSVTLADSVVITRSLLSPPAATQTRPDLCHVGSSAGCTLSDAVIVRRALLAPPTATIGQVCPPAAQP